MTKNSELSKNDIELGGVIVEIITLKEVARSTQLSYTYLYENKLKFGFFQIEKKGKWLANKETFDKLINQHNNNNRLTPKEVIKCQSKNVVKHGISTSSRQTAQELENLLVRYDRKKESVRVSRQIKERTLRG